MKPDASRAHWCSWCAFQYLPGGAGQCKQCPFENRILLLLCIVVPLGRASEYSLVGQGYSHGYSHGSILGQTNRSDPVKGRGEFISHHPIIRPPNRKTVLLLGVICSQTAPLNPPLFGVCLLKAPTSKQGWEAALVRPGLSQLGTGKKFWEWLKGELTSKNITFQTKGSRKKKCRIRETLNLSTDADHRNNIFFLGGGW